MFSLSFSDFFYQFFPNHLVNPKVHFFRVFWLCAATHFWTLKRPKFAWNTVLKQEYVLIFLNKWVFDRFWQFLPVFEWPHARPSTSRNTRRKCRISGHFKNILVIFRECQTQESRKILGRIRFVGVWKLLLTSFPSWYTKSKSRNQYLLFQVSEKSGRTAYSKNRPVWFFTHYPKWGLTRNIVIPQITIGTEV